MYFEQQNLFPSLNQSNEDLRNMINLSASNEEYVLQDCGFGQQNFQSNSNTDSNLIDQSSFGRPNNAVIVDSDNQNDTQSESDLILKNGYAKYETQIKSLLPQIHSHLIEKHKAEFLKTYQTRLDQYRNNMSLEYQNKIAEKIDKIKENITSNLSLNSENIAKLKEKLSTLKKSNKQSKTTLTQEQQHNLIQRTVDQIFNSQKLLNEIKQKLKPKVEQRVRFILIRDLEKQLTKCQNQIEDKIAEEREQFKLKRKVHWEQEAENQLKDLAVEFEQLKGKKTVMENAVKQKLHEKQEIIKKYKVLVENFKEAKQLEKNIKILQEKTSKTNNKKRNNSKSIQTKSRKKD